MAQRIHQKSESSRFAAFFFELPGIKSAMAWQAQVDAIVLDETAAAVVWLCSDAATFVVGHAMVIDGSQTA
jgi:hypothetical protein